MGGVSRGVLDILSLGRADVSLGNERGCRCERRSLLADKVLAKTDYDCDREIRTLELLKLRFGEANLHNCEVCIVPQIIDFRLRACAMLGPLLTPLSATLI